MREVKIRGVSAHTHDGVIDNEGLGSQVTLAALFLLGSHREVDSLCGETDS